MIMSPIQLYQLATRLFNLIHWLNALIEPVYNDQNQDNKDISSIEMEAKMKAEGYNTKNGSKQEQKIALNPFTLLARYLVFFFKAKIS